MPADLLVREGTTVVFDDNPGPDAEPYVERVRIERLSDLVDAGLVRSPDTLEQLLEAGKDVTTRAITNLDVVRPVRRVAGTGRVDLGRFASFDHAAGDVAPGERQAFWRFFREVDPTLVKRLTASEVLAVRKPWMKEIVKVLTADCTVEPGATLVFDGSDKWFMCGHLMIRKTGRIRVKGGAVSIHAKSIEGEQ